MRWWRRANTTDLRPKLMFYIIHRNRVLACSRWSFFDREILLMDGQSDYRRKELIQTTVSFEVELLQSG